MAFSSSASAGPNAAPVVVTPASNTNERVDKSGEYFVAAPPPLHQRKIEYPVALPMRTDTTTTNTSTAVSLPPNNNNNSSSHNSAILLELNVQYDHPTIARDSGAATPLTTSADGAQQQQQHGLCTICRPVTSPVSVSGGENSDSDKNLIFYRPQMALHKVLQQGTAVAAAAVNTENGTQENNEQPSHKEDSATTAPAASATVITAAAKDNSNDHTTRVTVPSHLLPYVTLYGPQKQALWSLTSKDWHTMDFSSPQLDHVITLTTSTSLFSFVWLNRKTYQWRLLPATTTTTTTTTATTATQRNPQHHPYDLRCYYDDKLIAEFVDSRFVQWTATTEQQQQFNPAHDILFSSFLLLSGLLIHEHLSSILRSLGGGPEAVQLVTDPTFAATAMMDNNNNDYYFYDDDVSLGEDSFYGEREYANQGLVDGQHAPVTGRWYTSYHSGSLGGSRSIHGDGHGANTGHGAGSIKSIELDPGFLRCFWGYGFWWTWCPCCMPGGWFDRMWINCRLRRRKMANNTAPMSRSRQRRQRGWQQHHHPDQY